MDVEGHVAFIPIHVAYPDGTVARPNDPLPLPGKRVRQQLFEDLEAMGEKIGATMPHLSRYLPRTLWPATGATYEYVKDFVDRVSPAMYIRCVDKGTGILWAFCRHWVWGGYCKSSSNTKVTPMRVSLKPQRSKPSNRPLHTGGGNIIKRGGSPSSIS